MSLLILSCTKKNFVCSLILGELEFLNLLGLFCPFPENLRSYCLSENDS